MLPEAINEGLVVTIVGISVVFSFLTILVFAMFIMEKIMAFINKLFPPIAPVVVTKKPASSNCDEEIALAIVSAYLKK